jgi:serine/threonine protein kinase
MRLGFYEILAPLGAGGMGEVNRARDTRLGREVALKLLKPDFAGDAERIERGIVSTRCCAASGCSAGRARPRRWLRC